jgi:hypothetical protein
VTAKRILFRILVCATIVLLWLWMSADDWEQEMINERVEQERIDSIQAYNKRMQSSALSEDDVDTTPVAIPEAEPTYISAPVQRAKKTVVKTKKRIKKTVKGQAR